MSNTMKEIVFSGAEGIKKLGVEFGELSKKEDYRIWMEKSATIPEIKAGWFKFTHSSGGNDYIYGRVQNAKEASLFNAHSLMKEMREMRRLGYACHAEPPLCMVEYF